MVRASFCSGVHIRSSALVALVVCGVVAGPASAAVSGQNGKIAFEQNDGEDREIVTINPDGSERIRLTDNSVNDHNPAMASRRRSDRVRSLSGS